MENLSIKVSVGELIDKLSILEIKTKKITDKNKLSFVYDEYKILKEKSSFFFENEVVDELYKKLLITNLLLWEIEDKIRDKERQKKFDDEFVDLARKVYITNDKRFELKNQINQICNSVIKEQKSYEKY
jgi:hypothetical protein